VIEFTTGEVPEDALVFACAPSRVLRPIVDLAARRVLLAPGVQEAESDDAAVDALIAFRHRVGKLLETLGVMP
jgi:hypothetical protein